MVWRSKQMAALGFGIALLFVPQASVARDTYQQLASYAPKSPNSQGCNSDPLHGAEQRALLREINRTRADHGLRPVSYNDRLARAAHDHACTNARAGRISHTGPGGTRPGHRAHRAGYDYRIVAENLGLGFHGAQQAMFYWMRSPGHRDNVLKPQVDEAALGLVRTERGQLTWVLLLGKER